MKMNQRGRRNKGELRICLWWKSLKPLREYTHTHTHTHTHSSIKRTYVKYPEKRM